MAAPDYVPVTLRDKPRTALPIPPPRQWLAKRPADLDRGQPEGERFGVQGPDQGYALRLAEVLIPKLELAPGEIRADVVAGCLPVALRRAGMFGRAPVIHDLDLAFRVWGFLGGAPAELVEFRKPMFFGAAHEYFKTLEIAYRVPEATLRLTPAQVGQRLASWRELLAA
jgi:hypothetical protein